MASTGGGSVVTGPPRTSGHGRSAAKKTVRLGPTGRQGRKSRSPVPLVPADPDLAPAAFGGQSRECATEPGGAMFGQVSLTLPAEIGAREAAQLTRALEVLSSGPVAIVLYASGVETVSRAARLLLETAHLRLQHPSARLRIVDPSPALGCTASPI